MSETSEYNEQEMAAYLFPFYAMSDRDGVELTCEKVSAKLKEWLDANIEAMKCCGNCHFYNPLIGAQDQCEKNNKPAYGNGICDDWELGL